MSYIISYKAASAGLGIHQDRLSPAEVDQTFQVGVPLITLWSNTEIAFSNIFIVCLRCSTDRHLGHMGSEDFDRDAAFSNRTRKPCSQYAPEDLYWHRDSLGRYISLSHRFSVRTASAVDQNEWFVFNKWRDAVHRHRAQHGYRHLACSCTTLYCQSDSDASGAEEKDYVSTRVSLTCPVPVHWSGCCRVQDCPKPRQDVGALSTGGLGDDRSILLGHVFNYSANAEILGGLADRESAC